MNEISGILGTSELNMNRAYFQNVASTRQNCSFLDQNDNIYGGVCAVLFVVVLVSVNLTQGKLGNEILIERVPLRRVL